MTAGSLHRFPLGQKANWALKPLLQWRIKLRIITLHYAPVVLLSVVVVTGITVRSLDTWKSSSTLKLEASG